MFIPPVFSPDNITYADNYSAIAGATFTETTSSCKDIDNCRTLLQIVWSCISVLIACTWSSIHPNIPGPNEQTGKVLGNAIGLMFVALIAPEMLIFWAARQWAAARRLSKAYRRHGWTTTHALFALMGGFALYEGKRCIAVLRFIPRHIDQEEKDKILDDLKRKEEEENFYISQLRTTTTPNIPKDGMDISAKPKFHDQSFAAHVCFIGSIPEVQVKDRSHSDGFSKLVAVGQTTWFVIQLIARWATKLPITELELTTLAFAALNVLIYFFWWHKPKGVGCHIPIQLQSMAVTAPEEGVSSLQQGLKEIFMTVAWMILELSRIILSAPKIVLNIILDNGSAPIHPHVSSFERCSDLEHKYRERIITSVAAVLFGAIHCIAWKFIFPSTCEQWLWRISSLVITCVPLVLVMSLAVEYRSGSIPAWIVQFCVFSIPSVMVPLYVVARLDLIVQAFLALRDLPLGAFETVQWTAYIPHI